MSEEDAEVWERMQISVKGGRLNRSDGAVMYQIYNRTFNAAAKPCNCAGKNSDMVKKLQRAYELRCT